jgi:hypothetical protein
METIEITSSQATTEVTWTVKGHNGKSADKESIPIMELMDGVSMNERNGEPLGIPVTAHHGISLMKNLLKLMKDAGLDLGNLPSLRLEQLDVTKLEILGQLLIASFGMTFDRSILLKILSQPGCEGMRFYPCIKKVEGKDYLSLVMVGVNKNGFDLLYSKDNYSKVLHDQINLSLVCEYGHPPYPGTRLPEDRYSLLRMAEESLNRENSQMS